MYSPATQSNPFALLMDPEAVFRSIEKSDRLGALRRHVCRPLDKPMVPRTPEAGLADFDDELELKSDDNGQEEL